MLKEICGRDTLFRHTLVDDKHQSLYLQENEIVVVSSDWSHLKSTHDVVNVIKGDVQSAASILSLVNLSSVNRVTKHLHAKVENVDDYNAPPCGRNGIVAAIHGLQDVTNFCFWSHDTSLCKGIDTVQTACVQATSRVVSYAAFCGIRGAPREVWHALLNSRLLAMHHLDWVRRQFTDEDHPVFPVWSPLREMRGTVFVTVYDADGKTTLSCFGSFEQEKNTLQQACEHAIETIKTTRWNSKARISESNWKDDYRISISLIEPEVFWHLNKDSCEVGKVCRAVEAANNKTKLSLYLQSVWQHFKGKKRSKAFTHGLSRKSGHPNTNHLDFMIAESITWKERRPRKATGGMKSF